MDQTEMQVNFIAINSHVKQTFFWFSLNSLLNQLKMIINENGISTFVNILFTNPAVLRFNYNPKRFIQSLHIRSMASTSKRFDFKCQYGSVT
jgi:regulatory protein YycH of two-component signal transduction system YycFG